jgi:hypothetical protein
MHSELVTKEPAITLAENDDALPAETVTYKGAKVIYLAAHRSKQMIREEEEATRSQAAQIKNLPYGSISFHWLQPFKNWCSKFFSSKK